METYSFSNDKNEGFKNYIFLQKNAIEKLRQDRLIKNLYKYYYYIFSMTFYLSTTII